MRGLPRAVRDALTKARDSALLAVEVYNKPAVTFKSAAYVTLMVIAWTSLLHAVFFRRKIKPYYRKKPDRRYKRHASHFSTGIYKDINETAELFGIAVVKPQS